MKWTRGDDYCGDLGMKSKYVECNNDKDKKMNEDVYKAFYAPLSCDKCGQRFKFKREIREHKLDAHSY